MSKDKVPFHSKIDDFENFSNSYHPEMFDLLNYYQGFDDKENKNYQDSLDESQNKESAKYSLEFNNMLDPNYPEF